MRKTGDICIHQKNRVLLPKRARVSRCVAGALRVANQGLGGTAVYAAATLVVTNSASARGAGRRECNQPAASQELGMENSAHPQSRQTHMSGEGVMGGWLMVRRILR